MYEKAVLSTSLFTAAIKQDSHNIDHIQLYGRWLLDKDFIVDV